MRPPAKMNMNVSSWFQTLAPDAVFLNTISETEILTGAYAVSDNVQKNRLLDLWAGISKSFETLGYDRAALVAAAKYRAAEKSAGRVVSFADAAIAGIAAHNNCTLATRNIKDFQNAPCPVFNPFGKQVSGK